MRKYYLIIVLCFISFRVFSQELNCNVNVSAPQLQGLDIQKVFQTLRTAIFEFMNNQAWTDHIYDLDERIDCNIMFTISEQISSDEFRGTLQVQARRPVFGSSYTTTLLNHKDNDLQFRYQEFQTLDFNETSFTSNLTSILAFYAYIILGLDYDSFSLEGGTQYFQKAEVIVNNAQNTSQSGWKAYEGLQNRFHMVENYLNPIFAPLRECMYNFHRMGLDRLTDRESEARSMIADGLSLLQAVHNSKPSSFALQLFFNAKADEIVNIFGKSFPDEKSKVARLLKEIDPANIRKYESLQK